MIGPRSRNHTLPRIAVLFLLVLVTPLARTPAAPAARDVLARQGRALVEQDLAVALEGIGRGEEAASHYRAAVGFDPWLKTPWVRLAARALEAGSVEQAAHLAGVAVAIAPQDESARRLLDQAQGGLPSTDQARRAAAPVCGDRGVPSLTAEARDGLRTCLERRAGLLSGAGDAEPLTDLAGLDLADDKPESAALLLTIATAMGAKESTLLGQALALSGNPCGAAQADGRDVSLQDACAAARARRGPAERELRADLDGLDAAGRLRAMGQIENLLGAGLDAQAAARRWRIDKRRGSRELLDLGGLTARLGQDWVQSHDRESVVERSWHRRPGDSGLVVFALRAQGGAAGAGTGGEAEAALARLLTPRRPAALSWAAVSLTATDPVRARMTALSLDADVGGRVEGWAWLAESPAAPGLALVVAAFPGTGGLGHEGLEQTRAEIQEALAGAVLVPTHWDSLTVLDPAAGEEFPVPIAGGRTLPGDETTSPWRTYPAGEFTHALPPGANAAPPAGAPEASALRRASAVLWFRGRFRDRDGVDVALGDETRAASVDLLTAANEDEARARALGHGAAAEPPISDRDAVLVTTLDITKTLGAETGASAASIARFRTASPGIEWLVCRLAFGVRLMEIDLPALEGAKSIALYWIPATVRPIHGPPPPPPVDLSGRLGILFLRPPPTERRESFYKEGDLRSAEFTMIVARGYSVVLDTVSPDAFPVRLTHEDGAAVVRLEKLPPDPAGGSAGSPEALRTRLEAAVRAWLAREGFDLAGTIVPAVDFKLSRSGASAGLDATFTAVRARTGAKAVAGAVSAKDPAAKEEPGSAEGRALLLCRRDGVAFVFLAISWDSDTPHRIEEIDLMTGSLHLLRTKKESRP